MQFTIKVFQRILMLYNLTSAIKITADGDCSHEIKRRLLLGRSYDQPRQHIKKQRHYFVNKGPSSQGYCSPVVMYGCESWTIKKADALN